MDVNSLIYSKLDGTKEQRVIPEMELRPLPDITVPPSLNLSADYQKQDGERSPQLLFVVSGGAVREKNYLQPLQNLRTIKLAFASKSGQGLSPAQIDALISDYLSKSEFRTEGDVYHIEEGDCIFVLQDVDVFEDELQTILPNQPKMVHWLISNPCFEIWLYYHYVSDDPHVRLGQMVPLSTAERSRWLKRELNNLVLGGISPQKAMEQLTVAIDRAQKYYREDDGIPSLFATRVYKLGEQIQSVSGDELQKFWRRKQDQIEAYKARNAEAKIPYANLSGKKVAMLQADLLGIERTAKLDLPAILDLDQSAMQYENKVFTAAYQIEKRYLDDAKSDVVVNTAELFMHSILQDVRNYYSSLIMMQYPLYSYNIDYNHLADAFARMQLTDEYVVLSTMHLAQLGVSYYKIAGFGDQIYIMEKKYVPRVMWKAYEGDNPDFKAVASDSMIYSNLHHAIEYDDTYGITMMRAARFQIPVDGCFRMLCLNVTIDKEIESQHEKIHPRTLLALRYNPSDIICYKNHIRSIRQLNDDGTILLNHVAEPVMVDEIYPVEIDSAMAHSVYHDPVIAASTIGSDGKIPIRTRNEDYFMNAFRNVILSDGHNAHDAVVESNLHYIHEVQHWMQNVMGIADLRIRFSAEFA